MSGPEPSASYKPLLIEAIREIRQLKAQLAEREAAPASAPAPDREPIAIVGAGCRFPGASGVSAYWDFLARGGDGVREIPPDRWPVDTHFDAHAGRPGKIYTRAAGFIDGVDQFDADFFGISPREAKATDPQHRLLLETAWEALENAAIVPASLRGTRAGVYVGIMGQDYAQLTRDPQGIDLYTGIGNLASVAAGRLAYWLGVHGPTMSIDTACSSSLVAVHLACRSLRSGETDLALAGGVNLILSPFVMMMICTARMLSPDGRCKTFDQSADGFGRGEGCGLVVLKRLSDARRDGDRILALIHGSAINHGGRAAGLTVPNQEAQAEVIRQALADAGVAGHQVQLLEAHGTGTSLGDPIEIAAAAEAYGADRSRPQPLVIGSVKTNFGHLEGAAGIASLIKAALAVRQGVVPPHLRLSRPNPYIDWESLSITVPQVTTDWPPTAGARLAGVSSFGLSGTNAHVIVGEPPAAAARPTAPSPCRILLALSAQTAQALRDKADQLVRYLAEQPAPGLRLEDVAHTLLLGRQHFEHRAAFVVADGSAAAAALAAFAQGGSDGDCRVGDASQAPASSDLIGRIGRALIDRSLTCRDQAGPLREVLLGLADLYCQGHQPPWERLFDGLGARRIELPTYPFQRQRYWLSEPVDAAAGAAAALHPLAQHNTSDFDTQRYSASFHGREFFLADHRVRGERVLPGVAWLEMARAAMQAASGEAGGGGQGGQDAPVRLRHVVWSRPLTVAAGPLRAHLTLRPVADGSVRCELRSDGPDGPVAHAQCEIEAIASPAEVAQVDLTALRERCTRGSWPAADCYTRFARAGLDYGPAMRALESLHRGDGEVLAQLVLPAALVAGRAAYAMHPSLLDAALQSLIGLADEAADASLAWLPYALDEIEWRLPFTDRLWAHARTVSGAAADSRLRRYDIDVYDDAGRLCACLRGLAVRPLAAALPHGEGSAPSTEPVAATDTLLLRSEWQPLPLAPAAAPPPFDRRVLVCGQAAADLASRLAGQLGVRCDALAGDFADQAEALLAHVQAVLEARPSRATLLQLLVPLAGPGQLSAGLVGLIRTAHLEHPQLLGQLIVTDHTDDTDAADVLAARLQECARDADTAEVRYQDGVRSTRAWVALEATAPQRPWKDGGVYLLTGGTGTLARILAREIATRARGAVLVLAGRRGPDAASRQQVRELEALGAVVELHALDVTDRAAVRRLVLQVQEQHQALDGIVHAAGVLRDGLLLNKSPQALREVLAPKVSGLLHLDEASRDIELDVFVCFSSVSALRGHVGQADYAAANAFMDAFATYRNALRAAGRRHGRTLSLNWPLWREGGMQVDPAVERAVTRATGMGAMSTADGLDALDRAWGSGLDQVAVLCGDADRLRQALAAPSRPSAPAPAPEAPPAPRAARADAATTVVASAVTLAPGPAASALLEPTAQYLRRLFARSLHLALDKVDVDAPLEKYGIDSIIAMELTTELELVFGTLSKVLFFEYQTLRALAGHFVEQHGPRLGTLLGEPAVAPAAPAAAPTPAQPARRHGTVAQAAVRPPAAPPSASPGDEGIAIIGLAGRYPRARDLASFWDNLCRGVDCISEIPVERWDHGRYYDADPHQPGKTYAKWGGFIDGVAEFDPQFFGIAPSEAELIDPQERLFLQCAWAALEDAGYTREMLAACGAPGLGGQVGVYVGLMYEEYQLHAAQQQQLGHAVTVTASPASVANRVSYFLNLHGPSMTVDTMCSSSLTAIHLACESLRSGACAVAIAGGVNVSIHPNKYLLLGQGRFASSKGQCESFGVGGDGYVPGEGVGAVLLKPLSRAEADGDQIHGVIRASALNHGGKTNGYTVPNPLAQAQVIAQALGQVQIDPRAISCVEAHGTGTSLGDPIEIAGLVRAFGLPAETGWRCAIGSVKSNIGHAESAAGIAGLTKLLLQMRHGQLVPSLHSRALNPNIDWTRTPFVVQQDLAVWQRPVIEVDGRPIEQPRLAGLSSFGAGGSNAHLIIEEHRPVSAPTGSRLPEGQPALIVLSARNAERLRERAQQLLDAADRGDIHDDNLADVAYTLQVGREPMDQRLAMAVPTAAALRERLGQWLRDDDAAPADVCRGDARRARDDIAWLGTDDDVAALMASWAARGQHGRLLELWVRGFKVDWKLLYGPTRPRRISLPTYPFATERCWLPMLAPAAIAASAATAVLHPLVHRNTSDFAAQRFSSRFDGQESFLADHRVNGRKVLPAAAHLELARAAMLRADTDAPGALRLRDLVWSSPLRVDGPPTEVHISLFPRDDGPVAFEIAGPPAGEGDDLVLFSQGLADLIAPPPPALIHLAAWRAQCQRAEWAGEVCYDAFARRGLGYGPAHRVIETLWQGDEQVLARLVLAPAQAGEVAAYGLHPSLLDGAFQSLIGLLGGPQAAADGVAALPFALDELTYLAPCGDRLWVAARPSPSRRSDERVRRFDLDLCNDDGLVCVRLRGFSTREVQPGATAATAVLLLRPQWQAARADAVDTPPGPRRVLLCDGSIDAAALALRVGAGCEALPEGYAAQARACLEQVKALLAEHPKVPLLLQVVVPEFGARQVAVGLTGLLRSASLEHPRLKAQVIAIDCDDEVDLLAARLEENRRQAHEVHDAQVRYVEGERQVLGWRELSAVDAPPVPPWKAGGVYLVTGGLGGLGRVFACELARQAHGVTLVLCGRRALDDAGRQHLQELSALGATAEYHAIDLSDRAAVQRLVSQVTSEHRALHGIVHSAGLLRDGLLASKSIADFDAVLAPKVQGLLNLDEATRDLALECFVCFSSISAVLGNAGQTDYAAANAFMDAFAAYRNSLMAIGQRQGRSLSVNWPLWDEGGMQLDEAGREAMHRATGMVALSTAAGVEAFHRAWGSGLDQVAVLVGDPQRLRAAFVARAPAPAPRSASVADSHNAHTDGAAAGHLQGAALVDKIRQLLVRAVSAQLKVRAEDVDPDADFHDHGFDSVSLTNYANRLNRECGTQIVPPLFFEHPTLNQLAEHLASDCAALFDAHFAGPGTAPAATRPAAAALAGTAASAAVLPRRHGAARRPAPAGAGVERAERAERAEREPVAIIGISACFPQADDLQAFWRNLVEGRDCISEVPSDRWDWRAVHGDPALEPNKTLSQWGGFIAGMAEFDPLFFGISPKEAELMDPQQRLLLQHAWNCIEDAGYSAASLVGSRTAIFAGTGSSGYSRRVDQSGLPLDGTTATGAVPSVGPNRVSFFLDLLGPSEPIETACSSALVAIHRGVRALERGDCDMALVGGVNTLVGPEATISFSQAGMLSADGRCKTFSDRANGYVRGEGVGLLLLKRLGAAERDGDTIHAVIRGTAQNHGGRASSLTAPNPKSQAAVIVSAMHEAAIDPRSVGYIEAHGTGTPLGDPVEVNGLKMAFRDLYAAAGVPRADQPHCAIGSVKTNIGHLELAAGVAGVIKVVLQMQHKTLAPSLHCERINPYVQLDDSPFYIVREAREWPAPLDAQGRALPRRAGVSSFGFGGVNAHVVLEEHVPRSAAPGARIDADHPALIVLSARNDARLADRVAQLREAIRQGVVTAANLADAAYTLQVGREAMDSRLALLARSVEELASRLDAVMAGEAGLAEVYRGNVRQHKQELALFTHDDDAMHMLQSWQDKGKFDRLLELWTKGLALDWARLYGAQRPRRMRLPAYPFARERCWVSVPTGLPGRGAAPVAARLHPLLHRNTSSLAEQRFSTDFTGDEFFLADHQVRGQKVLPGVAQLEMARAAIAHALAPDAPAAAGFFLEQVSFSRPIAVEPRALTCHVSLQPDEQGHIAYRIHGQPEPLAEAEVYSQGRTGLIDAPAPRQDLGALVAACQAFQATSEACYSFLAEHGLVLGPSFRALQAVHVGDQQVVGRLQLPAALQAEAGRFVLHPCTMDAALHATVGLTLADGGGPARLALPFALERLEIFAATQASMWSCVRRSAGSQPGDRVQKFDVDLCDDEGRVCVRYLGFSTRAYDGGNASAALPDQAATLLLHPQWQPRAVPTGEPGADNGPVTRHRLVLVCGPEAAAPCAELGALTGRRCHALPGDYAAQAEALLAHLQSLGPRAASAQEPVMVQVVVPAGQPLSEGLAGMLRCARLEDPRLLGQLIRLDEPTPTAVLAERLQADAARPEDVQVRYADGQRQVLGWTEWPASGPAPMPWKPGSVVLITGGLGGLGRLVAEDIARRSAGATLVLTGRRALDDAGRQHVRALEAMGARVDYRVLDVADGAAVRQTVLQIHEDHQGLDSILHAAGVLRDGLLAHKTVQDLREVLASKVSGLIHLDEASRDLALQSFVCFSSVAAVTGNLGQADYAAANGFMDAWAAQRQDQVERGQRQGRTLSVNWPLWRDGGMRVDEAIERAMQRASGLVALPTAAGLAALAQALAAGRPQALVMHGDAVRLRRVIASAPAPALAAGQAAAAAVLGAASPQAAVGTDFEPLKRRLVAIVAEQCKVPPEAISGDTELNEYGFDSIMLTELGHRLNRDHRLDLVPTVFFEYPTIDALTQHIGTRYGAHFPELQASMSAAVAAPVPVATAQVPTRWRVAPAGRPAPASAVAEPVAIIGMAGQFPQAGDLEALWDNLRQGRDSVTELPADRWDMARYHDPQPGRLGKSASKWGGFIEGIDRFDSLLFNISPRDAQGLDPQVRLFLQTVWTLVESSGHTRESLRRRHEGRVGVYVGAMAQPTQPADNGDQITAALSAASAIANRVSHFFNFQGPSFAVDTMCSSAMQALHLACRDLQSGECELAVAGGVCLLLSPQKYVGMSQARLYGSDPSARCFCDGDGYQPAETVGAVLLKPLRAALADGDPILAVIKGTATQHSGRSNGYAAPNPTVQTRVMAESLRRAGLQPQDIGWVEAAATGTALGDAIEVAALGSVFGVLAAQGQRVPVGAVKSHLGHSEHGSAMAQIAKVLLQLQYRQLIPLLPIGKPNPQLRLDASPLVLQRELTAWAAPIGADGLARPRRALVNSFGAGGSCVSAVIEEYLPADAPADANADAAAGSQLFVFSARSGDRLRAVVQQTLQRLGRGEPVALADLAHTLQIGREAMDERLALVAATRAELCDGLQAWLDGRVHADLPLCRGTAEADRPSDAAAEALVAARDLTGLARHWVAGGGVPWAQLHADHAVRRIVWATYPFAPTVFPIDYEQGAPAGPDLATPAAAPDVRQAPADDSVDKLVAASLAASLGMSVSELPRRKPLQTLGYTSIAAMELKYRLEAAWQRPVALELLADGTRCCDELARHLAQAVPAATRSAVDASPRGAMLPVLVPQPQAQHETFALTDMQEAFLLGRQASIDGDTVGAHIYLEIDVKGPVDIQRLNRAWNRLIAHHAMLRTVVGEDGQRVQAEVPTHHCKVVDFRVMDQGTRQAKACSLRETMARRVFAANEWPLFDIRVALHGPDASRIHFSIDELIVDGLSVDRLIRQWDALYGQPDRALAPMDLSFRDYVLAMKAFEASDTVRQDLAYWQTRLAQAPGGPQLPRPLVPGTAHRSRLERRLPAAAWQALKARAGDWGVSPTALVLGLFTETLRQWSAEPAFTLVLTHFNRPPLHPQMRELVGPAISSLLYVVQASGDTDLRALIRRHHQQLWQDLEHSSVSGVKALRQARRGRGSALSLPVVFTSMLGSEVSTEPLQHLGEVGHIVNHTPQVSIDHQVRESARGLDLSWDVAEGHFAPGLIAAMFDAYASALQGLADDRLPWLVSSLAPRPGAADPVCLRLAQCLDEVRRSDPHGPFPLTDQQQAYAFGRDAAIEGGSSCQFCQELQVAELDFGRLEQAVARLITRHPMLRTVVESDGRQVERAGLPPYRIAQHDLRGLDAHRQGQALAATRHALLAHATPLGGWPSFNLSVSWLDGSRACLHLCFDLLLVDSTSIGLLLVELIRLYTDAAELSAPPALSFAQYQRAVERFAHSAGHAVALEYWNQRFATLPGGPQLPQLQPPRAAGHRRIAGQLPAWAALKQQALARGLAPGQVLLAAYLEVLYAWNDHQPLAVVVPGWERLPVHPEIERVVGDFTTLSWIERTQAPQRFDERLADIAQQHASDLAQRPVSGLQALRRVMLRQRKRPLRYPVVFTNLITPLALPAGPFELGPAISKTPQVLLDNLSHEAAGVLHCAWDFAAGVYAPAMVQEMVDGYLRLLAELARDPHTWQRRDFDDIVRARPQAYATADDKLEGVV
jgi:polyketide synthase PksN